MGRRRQHPLVIRTHSLTVENSQLLHQLGQEASDRLGWTIGGSAIVRALLTYAERQPPAWASSTLFPLIEEEIAAGRVWGSKKQ
jgi:hypothetical protein